MISATTGVLAAGSKPDASTCELHLPAGKPVEIHFKLGPHKPSDWVAQVTAV
jgi:hypothetical protein